MENIIRQVPLEPREIQLRAYTVLDKPEFKSRGEKPQPTNRVLVFDTETTADAAQQLRFGAFQIRDGDDPFRQGVFYDRDGLSVDEIETLEACVFGTDLEIMPVEEFIEEIFFQECAYLDGTCVGFNLPFDLSSLAIDHGTAKGGKRSTLFQHGFSLQLSPNSKRSRVKIKHLSHRAAFIEFAGIKQPQNPKKKSRKFERPKGFFVDVKTFAGALLAESHSLASLSIALDVKHKKSASDKHDELLTPEYVQYALKDVQCTWECYAELQKRLERHKLPNIHARQLFSEASLGKAYLKALGVKPWREVQPEFPKSRIGEILSTYYGGRSEVNIRREFPEVAYCDFLSMYPTVNTLMRLWQFVIANGISETDATIEARDILKSWTARELQNPENWQRLSVIVQIVPDDDVLPVRAIYGDQLPRNEQNRVANIGLNRLTCEAPLWFTLADCLASKLLTGKAPKVIRAVRFTPIGQQDELRSVAVSGNNAYLVDPANEDFFKRIIQLRRTVVGDRDKSSGARKQKLDTEQKALKTLANSTSYGIFVETLVNDLDGQKSLTRYGYDGIPTAIKSTVEERPGSYFHPLLATLITGAARLMLALAEWKALDSGLDWVFCDTDGIAFAKPEAMSRADFIARVQLVSDFFKPLNPYGDDASILQMEDENFSAANAKDKDWGTAPPLYCYGVSAKRYALFNIINGKVVVRKASAHGLGHLLPPYENPNKSDKDNAKVAYWHKQLWTAICEAAIAGMDHNGEFIHDHRLNIPAASRYGANTPALLKWFSEYNSELPRSEQVKPFNFLLSFQARNLALLATSDSEAASWLQKRKPAPRPAGPYEKGPAKAAAKAFDRATKIPIPERWLQTYSDVLHKYHLHTEAKFHGGFDNARGKLWRRHIDAFAVRHIGKEAHNWEEDYYIGTDADSAIVHGDAIINRAKCAEVILAARKRFGVRDLRIAAGVGDSVLKAACEGEDRVKPEVLVRLVRAAYVLEVEDGAEAEEAARALEVLQRLVKERGIGAVARELRVDPANLRKIERGERLIPKLLLVRLHRFYEMGWAAPNTT
ncbi:MAG: hypothetical protein RLO80_07385 [Hyphomonas sp.]